MCKELKPRYTKVIQRACLNYSVVRVWDICIIRIPRNDELGIHNNARLYDTYLFRLMIQDIVIAYTNYRCY